MSLLPSHFGSPGIIDAPTMAPVLLGFWDVQVKSSHLHGKHFTHGAIAPASAPALCVYVYAQNMKHSISY